MTINIKDLKNKIIYRANYRGTKEMDKLLGSFTKKYINQFNQNIFVIAISGYIFDEGQFEKIAQLKAIHLE